MIKRVTLRFDLLSLLFLALAIAAGALHLVYWNNTGPIQWQRFTTERIATAAANGQTALILVKPRLGLVNQVAQSRLNHPSIQRAVHNGRLKILEYNFGYAEPIPPSERQEFDWIRSRHSFDKEPFAVIVYPNGTTKQVDALDPDKIIDELSLNWTHYAFLAIEFGLLILFAVSICFCINRNNSKVSKQSQMSNYY